MNTPPGRVPFFLQGVQVGSVAQQNAPLFGSFGTFSHAVRLAADGVHWIADDTSRTWAALNAALRERGLILGWRDEPFDVPDPVTGQVLAVIERAAARFWGTLTLGAHLNGYVAGPDGRPAELWIAQRAWSKPTDPGLYDNLVGGGVASGQTPREALVREAWEEAGLRGTLLDALVAAGELLIDREVAEGWQVERIHAFDLALPAGWAPQNQDGEVAGFTRMPVAQALALAARGAMTVDAARVTGDFAQRHGLVGPG